MACATLDMSGVPGDVAGFDGRIEGVSPAVRRSCCAAGPRR